MEMREGPSSNGTVGVVRETSGGGWYLGDDGGVCECVHVRAHVCLFLGSDWLGAVYHTHLVFLAGEIMHLKTQHLHHSQIVP